MNLALIIQPLPKLVLLVQPKHKAEQNTDNGTQMVQKGFDNEDIFVRAVAQSKLLAVI